MSAAWPRVPLGDLLIRSGRTVLLHPETIYKEVTVRMNGKGVVERRRVQGVEIASDRRYEACAGQFIISRIDARNGASGLVPDELDGAVVTNDFPLFNVAKDRLDPSFLNWMSKTASFVDLCKRASEGTTNRVRLSEDRFKALEIALPPLDEQRRIVARIEETAANVAEARRLRAQSTDELMVLAASGHYHWFDAIKEHARLGDVCEVIDPNPSHRYPAYVPKDVPMISTSDFIGDDQIDIAHAKHVPRSFFDETLGRFGVCSGDVIFARKGKVGYARQYPANAILAMTHTLCVLKPNRALLHPGYLLHFARSSGFLQYLTGTMNPNLGVPTLGLNVIRGASIPLPSIKEQRRIIKVLDDLQTKLNTVKTLQEETVGELDAMLPAILDKAFKGEL